MSWAQDLGTVVEAANLLRGETKIRFVFVGEGAQKASLQERARSLGLSKQLLNATFETDLSASLDREANAQAMATISPEMAEGMAAFAERRTPDFRGAR